MLEIELETNSGLLKQSKLDREAVQKSILFTMAWEFGTCVWMVKTC